MPMFNCKHCDKRINVRTSIIKAKKATYLCRKCFHKDVKLSKSLGLDPYSQ